MPDTATRPDRASLDRLAYSQGGYFRSAQAGELGFSKQLLAHHVRSGRFERVRRGLYRLLDYPASPDDQIRVAWMTVGDKAVVSHESALELLGLSDVMPKEDMMGFTDCPEECEVEADGVCEHGYESAARTAGII